MKPKIAKSVLALLLLGILSQGIAQGVISGTVRDEQDQPLPGTHIIIKNTAHGTTADADGKFQLNIDAPPRDEILTISAVGYVTQQIPVGQRSVIDVQMLPDVKTLSEVVVTGYTSQDKNKITGAVVTVSSDALAKLPVPTIDQALQGRAPGVTVTQNTGAPGEGVTIRVRGIGSINSGNYPLYIVDGVPTLDISNFSAQDIESLTVLKDAGAAAIYGARAANGVVVITTKSGAAQKPSISVASQIGFQQPGRLIKMVNKDDYVSVYNEAANNDNEGRPAFLHRSLITKEMQDTLSNTNWLQEIMRAGILQTHGVSVSGGTGKTKYFAGVNYFKQQGIIKASDYERITGKVNLSAQITDHVRTGFNLNIAQGKTDIIGSSGDGAGGNGGGIVRYAFFRNPALPVYNKDGAFQDLIPPRNVSGKSYNFSDIFGDGYNPVGMLAFNSNRKTNSQLFGRYFWEFKLAKGLLFNSNFGFDLSHYNQRRFDRTWGTNNRISNPNSLSVWSGKNQNLTFSNFLTYDKEMGIHSINILAGTEAIRSVSYLQFSSDGKFPDQDNSLVYLGNGLGLKQNSESINRNSLLSYFAKADYSLKNKYTASATVRRDGSSRFGNENRWASFYAGSLGWHIENENFLKDSPLFDKLFARAGFGVIGNQEIGNYAFSDVISANYNYPFGGARSAGYAVSALGNSKIKWESSEQLNVGLDIQCQEGKLGLSIDYFRKVTSDLLVKQSIASSAGEATPSWVNNGKILNRGFELALNYRNKLGELKYNINANGASLFNKVLDIQSPILSGEADGGAIARTEKGYSIGSFYMLESEGVFQDKAEIFTHAYQGAAIAPGDVKYKNINNKDSEIDNADRRHFGNAFPKVTAGLNIALNFRQWDMSVFFQGAYGQKIYNVLHMDIEGFKRGFPVTQRYFDQHWRGPGTSNLQPRASWDASGNNTRVSSRFLEDGSYTRLKNLQIGYSISPEVLKILKFTAARIYFSGTNLWTFTKYSGLDPEMSVNDNSKGEGDSAAGIDWGTYPSAKSFNVGINLTF